MPRFERHPSPSLSHTVPPVSVCVCRWQLAEGRKKKDQKSDRVLGPAKRRRGPPRSPVSPYPHPRALASVPRANVCAPSGPHGTAPWACPSAWESRLVIGQFRLYDARPPLPHPCSRAKSCRLAPRPNRRPPLMPVWLNATFLALANARGEFRRKEGICFLAPPPRGAWFGTRHDSCVSCSSRPASLARPSTLCTLSRRHLWSFIMPSRVAHAEPSGSMLHGNTCEVRDGGPTTQQIRRESAREMHR